MKKYKSELKRVTLKDYPLMAGQMALYLTEAEDGKLFSEIVENLLSTTSIKDAQQKNELLELRYILNVNINTAITQDDLDDLRFGLTRLDKASIDFRQKIALDDKQKVKESMRRTHANLHVNGLFDVNDFAQEFDVCTVDMSNMKIEDIEANMVYVAQISQRTNPTVFIIPTELANKLNDKEFSKGVLGKTFNAKILSLKNVFAPAEGLENNFVRAI